MSKFRKFSAAFVIAEILVLILFNIFLFRQPKESAGKEYRVDISRIATRIENGEPLSDIDTDDYKNITAVHIFDGYEYYKNPYEVHRIDDEFYSFEYMTNSDRNSLKVNIFAVMVIVANTLLLIYLDRKIVTPFSKMESMTTELAKGNLSIPLKQEKSRYFSRFIWGIDMLREKLEYDRNRELELLKEKKLLILSLSHDIKTPLSAIDLYAKALKRHIYKTEDEKNAVFSGIEKNISEIKRYMDEIIDASREDIIVLETENTEVYLSSVIKKIQEHYCEKMQNLHVAFSIDDTESALIYGDENRMVEVMQNVIENALKYGDGKEVTISFDEEEECKLVSIANSGCTLDKDEITHIFDSFYRGSNVASQTGSGLGLYICKALMRKMDGDIFAEIRNGYFVATLVFRKI